MRKIELFIARLQLKEEKRVKQQSHPSVVSSQYSICLNIFVNIPSDFFFIIEKQAIRLEL